MTRVPLPSLLPALVVWLTVAAVIGGTIAWIAGELGPSLATVGVRTVYACAGGCVVAFALATLAAAILAGSAGRRDRVGRQISELTFFWNVTLVAYAVTLTAFYAHRLGYLV